MKNKTAMHLMIEYLCSIGEYDIVGKANELLELEKEQHKKTWFDSGDQFSSNTYITFEQYYSEKFKQS